MSTTVIHQSRTLTFKGDALPPDHTPNELCAKYDQLVHSDRLGWTEYLRLKRLLGTGGQGWFI